MDKDKFREAEARGATLEDYAQLDKIKSPVLKNEVLESIGTNNFKWRLNGAIAKEELVEIRENFVKELAVWADEIGETDDMERLTQVLRIPHAKYSYNNFQPPEDCEDGNIGYFYAVCDTYIDIYADSADEEDDEDDEDDAAERELEERFEKLEELSDKAYQMRMDFAKTFSASSRGCDTVEKMAGLVLALDIGRIERETFADFTDIPAEDLPWQTSKEQKEDGIETFWEARRRILSHDEMRPLELLFAGTYLRMEDKGTFFNGQCQHWKNKELDRLYGFLCGLGYPMSDEEKALQDGTHELFMRKDG